MLEEKQRTRMCAESVNLRALKRRGGFGLCGIQAYLLLRSEHDVSCCMYPFARGASIA